MLWEGPKELFTGPAGFIGHSGDACFLIRPPSPRGGPSGGVGNSFPASGPPRHAAVCQFPLPVAGLKDYP